MWFLRTFGDSWAIVWIVFKTNSFSLIVSIPSCGFSTLPRLLRWHWVKGSMVVGFQLEFGPNHFWTVSLVWVLQLSTKITPVHKADSHFLKNQNESKGPARINEKLIDRPNQFCFFFLKKDALRWVHSSKKCSSNQQRQCGHFIWTFPDQFFQLFNLTQSCTGIFALSA